MTRLALAAAAVLLSMVFAASVLFWALSSRDDIVSKNSEAIALINREGEERRDQICLQAEREHLTSVQGLRLTYKYLANLTPPQRREPLNALLFKQLPRTEKEARIDVAPEFCDEPGAAAEAEGAHPVGLPEPDPVLPKRPAALKK